VNRQIKPEHKRISKPKRRPEGIGPVCFHGYLRKPFTNSILCAFLQFLMRQHISFLHVYPTYLVQIYEVHLNNTHQKNLTTPKKLVATYVKFYYIATLRSRNSKGGVFNDENLFQGRGMIPITENIENCVSDITGK